MIALRKPAIRPSKRVSPKRSRFSLPNAVLYDGIDDVGNAGHGASVDNHWDGGGAVGMWVYVSSDGGTNTGRLLDKRASGWSLQTLDEFGGNVALQLFIEFATSDGIFTTSARVVPLNEWTHIMMTYDASSVSNVPIIYINGVSVTVSVDQAPIGAVLSDSGQTLYIGNSESLTASLDGSLCGVGMVGKELTTMEALEWYNGGRGYNIMDSSFVPDVNAFYPMDRVIYPVIEDMANPNFGDDLVDSGAGTFDSGTYNWVAYATNTIANVANTLQVTGDGSDVRGAFNYLRATGDLSVNLTVGNVYEYRVTAMVDTGTAVVDISPDALVVDTIGTITTTLTTFTHVFLCGHATNAHIRFSGLSTGQTITVDNWSIKPANGSPALMVNQSQANVVAGVDAW